MKKVVIFAFEDDPMCFIHVLLNTLDMDARGMTARIVFEGRATGLVPELVKEGHKLNKLYRKAWDKGLIAGACRACSNQVGVLKEVEAAGVALLDDMNGHPGMAAWYEDGFEVLVAG